MGMLDFTIPHHFVMAALNGPKQKGLDITQLLHTVNITPDVLYSPMSRVSAMQYAKLIRAIWLNMGDEYMGLAQVESKLGTFAMMSKAVIHCPTLERAIMRGARFYDLFPAMPRITLQIENDIATLSIDDSRINDPDHFLMESLLVIWHRFGSWLIGRRIHLTKASFTYTAPAHHNEYRRLFNCDIHFSQSYAGIQFPIKFLHEKISQNEATLRKFLEHSPADLLAKPDEGDSIIAQIRNIIGDDFSNDLPNFEDIAEKLHTSPQTLRRRLKEEGITYQELKDQMRRDTAIYFLERGDLAIHEIAERLGFSEPSTFHRAFKKWTGITPGAYRQGEDQ